MAATSLDGKTFGLSGLRCASADRRWSAVAAFVLLVCVLTPNAILFGIDPDRQHLVWALSALVLYAAWMAAFSTVRRAIAFALPIFVLMPPISFFILAFQEFPGANVIAVLLDTNVHEASDFIDGRAVPIVVCLLGSLGIWGLLLTKTKRPAGTGEAAPVPSTQRHVRSVARGALLALAALIGLASTPWASGIDTGHAETGIATSNGLKALPFDLSRLANVFPVGPLVSAADLYIGERNRKAWQAAKADQSFGASLSAPNFKTRAAKSVYVLVIGESSRGDRWQLGGYGRRTNPRLAREANLVFLRDMITPWTFTLASVPVIASRKSGADHARYFNEKSILSLFKEVGFKTYWISNQARPAGIGSEIADISSEADEAEWLNIAARDYARETTYDIEVVKRLKATLAKDEARQFIVLHLMGSHDAYRSRYPASFNAFRPSLTDAPSKDDHDAANRDLVNNTYDNTIVYTDHVVHEAIAALKATQAEAGLFYTSDHGESLFDGACDFVGHGGTAQENYSVSALVWLSPTYVGTHPGALATLKRNAARRLSTENVFESMAGMAGISYAAARPARSILSERFAESDRMVNVGGVSVDWDRADFAGACHKPVPRQQGVAAR